MRGQHINYDSFNLVELIDELKTRITPPFRVDDTLHGAMIVGRDYHGTCKEIRKWLEKDDREVVDNNRNVKRDDICIISIDLEKVIINKQVLCGRDYGIKLRNIFDLDRIDKIVENQHNLKVIVMIPDTVHIIDSLFFRGMFKKSIERLGKDRFKKAYNFICNPIMDITIENGINSILTELRLNKRKCIDDKTNTVLKNMRHLNTEEQEEYNKNIDNLYKETDISIFDIEE
ncbi:hypothetical protein IRP63_14100 (plasmid) [Clostridium botulinum]|uniref:hypothetical protein n=1 Tax=Clostridium botulinum TaxID=1491 RepID=UPI0006A65BCA|nr:hypothetical protein [Clostridium botulinum]MCD3232582.1 hypothetical protein [Clostridium botulinum D/C]MCD3238489.1 hypothetical protein [Clostridium botulinum D/C]MCD3265991.1 hypothetical protein [Clostridium botulinum D/C]MCD3300281.1 hypothetical protein [Clostridium botulinum D/C]MCD3304230.1 hypothetical protein [Clostridium botulinum D/C]